MAGLSAATWADYKFLYRQPGVNPVSSINRRQVGGRLAAGGRQIGGFDTACLDDILLDT